MIFSLFWTCISVKKKAFNAQKSSKICKILQERLNKRLNSSSTCSSMSIIDD